MKNFESGFGGERQHSSEMSKENKEKIMQKLFEYEEDIFKDMNALMLHAPSQNNRIMRLRMNVAEISKMVREQAGISPEEWQKFYLKKGTDDSWLNEDEE